MEIIARIIIYLVLTAIVLSIVFGIGSCMDTTADRNARKRAVAMADNARYPKAGDKIELNGKEIVILKKYVWARERRYQVRLVNGTITDVMGSEIIDKKPIGAEENGKR